MAAFVNYTVRRQEYLRIGSLKIGLPKISYYRSLNPNDKNTSNLITLKTNSCGCDGILYYNTIKVKSFPEDKISYYTLPSIRNNFQDNFWVIPFDSNLNPINQGNQYYTTNEPPKLNCVCTENANLKCKQKDVDLQNGRHMSICVSEGDCASCFADSVTWGVQFTPTNWGSLSVYPSSQGGLFVRAKQVIKIPDEILS